MWKMLYPRPKLMGHDPQSLKQNRLHNTFYFIQTLALGRIEGQNIGTNYTCINSIHFICIKKLTCHCCRHDQSTSNSF